MEQKILVRNLLPDQIFRGDESLVDLTFSSSQRQDTFHKGQTILAQNLFSKEYKSSIFESRSFILEYQSLILEYQIWI